MSEQTVESKAMADLVRAASPIMAEYVAEHNRGSHAPAWSPSGDRVGGRKTGCPACMLGVQPPRWRP